MCLQIVTFEYSKALSDQFARRNKDNQKIPVKPGILENFTPYSVMPVNSQDMLYQFYL